MAFLNFEDRLCSEQSKNFYSKGVKRSAMAKTFLKSLCKNNRILGNGGPSKMRLGYFSYMKYFRFIDVAKVVYFSTVFPGLKSRLFEVKEEMIWANLSEIQSPPRFVILFNDFRTIQKSRISA